MAKLPLNFWTMAVAVLLVACSNQVLSAKRSLTNTGKNGSKSGDSDGKWFDKWYPSDTVYIDGDANHAKEGSGAGPMHGDLADIGSGSGPDDEDSIHGSGDGDFTDIPVGSGDGIWIDETSRPKPSTGTTPKSLWWQPTSRTSTTTQRWWPPRPETTTTKIRGITVFTDEEEESNVIEEEVTRPSAKVDTTTPPFNVVPTQEDTTIYDKESRNMNPFLRPGILAAVIGGAVVGLLAAILLVMFIVYRMRKKDEGSYALEEPKQPPSYPYAYHKAPTKEFYA